LNPEALWPLGRFFTSFLERPYSLEKDRMPFGVVAVINGSDRVLVHNQADERAETSVA